MNTSNRPISTQAVVRTTGRNAEWWDAFTGRAKPATLEAPGKTTSAIALELAPYESRVLVFSNRAPATQALEHSSQAGSLDLSTGWKVSFTGTKRALQMDRLRSWTDDEETRYYSGEAVYGKSASVSPSFLGSQNTVVLDFGPGEIVPPPAGSTPGMRALLESPVRESALVYVNGQLAGALWHPPYAIDITRFLQAGENRFRIVVANLAINEMAGRALPDYKLLNLRYGERFVPQGFENLAPLPAGILGSVKLLLKK